MKFKTLAALFILCSTHSFGLDIDEAKRLFVEKQYQQLEENIAPKQDLNLVAIKLNVLLKQEREDDAESFLEQVLSEHNSSQAALVLAGRIYSDIAQQVSIFSARSYAKKALTHYQKAYQLDTSNIEAAMSLFSFYLYAPGIAGGDNEKALEIVTALKKVDVKESMLAELRYLQKEGQQEQFQHLLNQANQQFKQDFRLAGLELQSLDEQYSKQLALFERVLSYPVKTEKDQESLNFLLYQMGKLSAEQALGLELGMNSLEKFYPYTEQPQYSDYRPWTELRMAQILAHQQKIKEAKKLAKQALASSDEKRLKKLAKKILKL